MRPEVADACAWQRFLPSGPLALLPVRRSHPTSADGRVSGLAWSFLFTARRANVHLAADVLRMPVACLCSKPGLARAVTTQMEQQPCLGAQCCSAILPTQVRNGYANVVWTTTPRHAAELEAATPDAFADAVNEVPSSCEATQHTQHARMSMTGCSVHLLPALHAIKALHMSTVVSQDDLTQFEGDFVQAPGSATNILHVLCFFASRAHPWT